MWLLENVKLLMWLAFCFLLGSANLENIIPNGFFSKRGKGTPLWSNSTRKHCCLGP